MAQWEDNVRHVTPYTPGEQPRIPDIIKLNTNENPYPPSPAVAENLRAMDIDALRLYPDPAAGELTEAVAAHFGVEKDRVFVGVGSDDCLAMSFLAFFNSGRPVLFADITYSFYDVWAGLFGIPFETVPLADDFTLRPEDYFRENGGIIIASPNAPTGLLPGTDAIRQILEHNPGVVVIVDEAYIDFGGESVAGLTEEYENLLVVQTFSKSRSLAGMRIGCAVGSRKLIKYLSDVKYSFNSYTMNLPSICAGAAAIADEAYFEETRKKIIATRERSKQELRALGFTFPDSQANFIFASHPEVPARELFAALRQAGIIVRYFDKPRIDNYLRITVGTDAQMDALIAFLRKFLAERKEKKL